jgi:hypothetical protein
VAFDNLTVSDLDRELIERLLNECRQRSLEKVKVELRPDPQFVVPVWWLEEMQLREG